MLTTCTVFSDGMHPKKFHKKLFLSSLVKTFDVHVVTHHAIFKAKITRSFKCRCIFCHKGKAIVIICRKVMILRKQKTHLFHEEQK